MVHYALRHLLTLPRAGRIRNKTCYIKMSGINDLPPIYSDLLLTLLPTRIINWCSKSYSRGTFFSHNKRTFVGGKGDRCFDWGFNSFKWLYQMIWVFTFYLYCSYQRRYSFWDRLCNFLHKFTWIVLSVHKLNKLGKFW